MLQGDDSQDGLPVADRAGIEMNKALASIIANSAAFKVGRRAPNL